MITRVSHADYIAIKNTFTENEIKEKYGKLVIVKKQRKKTRK